MNTFSYFVPLVLLLSAGKLQAICPTGQTSLGPCVPLQGAGLCPPEGYCQVNADNSNECCSGTGPPVTNCVNLIADCVNHVDLCTVNGYRDFMTKNCPLTCGRCSVTNCIDTPTPAAPGCPTWAAAGFCTSTFYTTDFKRANCAATCGFC